MTVFVVGCVSNQHGTGGPDGGKVETSPLKQFISTSPAKSSGTPSSYSSLLPKTMNENENARGRNLRRIGRNGQGKTCCLFQEKRTTTRTLKTMAKIDNTGSACRSTSDVCALLSSWINRPFNFQEGRRGGETRQLHENARSVDIFGNSARWLREP